MKAGGHFFYCLALFVLFLIIMGAYGYIQEVDDRHTAANIKLMNMMDDDQLFGR